MLPPSAGWFGYQILVALLALSTCSQALNITYCSRELVAEPNSTTSIYMSNGLCQLICQDTSVFVVISGTSCWCSDLAPANQLDTSLCNFPCPGYPDDTCGNPNQSLYAYFNLGQRPSGTGVALTALSIAATTATSNLATSDPLTASSFSTTATSSEGGTSAAAAAAATSSTGGSTSFTDTDTSDIALYIQTAIPASARSQSSNACFLNQGYSQYSTPTWYVEWPTQVQSYYSASNQGMTVACTLSASELNAANARSSSGGFSTGAKAGIAVGVILGALILAALLFLCVKRRNRRRRSQGLETSKADLEHEKPVVPIATYANTNLHHNHTARSSDEDFTALPAPPATAHHQTTVPTYMGAAVGRHRSNSIQSTPSSSEFYGEHPSKPWMNYANQSARSEMSEDQQFFPALQQQNPYQLDPDLDFRENGNGIGKQRGIQRKPIGSNMGQVVHPGQGAGGFGHVSDHAGGYESGGERSWYHAK